MLTLNQFGLEPRYKITIDDGSQTRVFNQDEILSVSGLEAIVKNAGSAGTSSFSAVISDPNRSIYSLISASFLFREVVVTRDFYDHTETLINSVEVFNGLVNPPLAWDEANQSLTLNGLSKNEGKPIGYSINRSDDPQLIYEELHGKAWPLSFGTVKQQPTLEFLIGEDGTLDPSGSEELRTGSATVASMNIGNLTRSDLEAYAELIKETKIKGFDPANLGLWKRGGLLYPVSGYPEAYLLFNTRKRVLTTTPDGTSIDVETQPANKFNKFEESFESRIKLSDFESTFYNKTGSEQSKIDFKEAVIGWCNKYLEYFTLTTVQKLAYNQTNNLKGNLKNLEPLAEKYANIESPYETELTTALGTADLLNDIEDLYVTNNTLEQRTSGNYQINLNGARFTCTKSESKLTIQNILPACENINISQTDDLRVNAFKSTDNRDLTNMYCLIGDKVIYITGSVVERDGNGDFDYVTYTFDNLYYDTFVKKYVPVSGDDYEYFGHYIVPKVIDENKID